MKKPLILTLVTSLLFFWLQTCAAAEKTKIGVIYPDIQAPYDRIFSDIINGIQEEDKTVKFLKTNDSTTTKSLGQWISENQLQHLIVLGYGPKKLLESGNFKNIGVTYGALKLPDDEELAGISIVPEPAKMLTQLKQMVPSVKHVHVFVQGDASHWMVERAKTTAARHEIEIKVLDLSDKKNLSQLASFLEQLKPGTDAIWLNMTDNAIDRNLLRDILINAWTHKIIVFSSQLGDVKRGALFSLFPDNQAMGRSLYQLAKKALNNDNTGDEVLKQGLTDVFIAVNIRTAGHLGLQFQKTELEVFKLTFPSK